MVVVLNWHVAAEFIFTWTELVLTRRLYQFTQFLFYFGTEQTLCTMYSHVHFIHWPTVTCAPYTQTYPQTYTPQQADQYLGAAHSGREGDQQGEVEHLHHSWEPDPRPQLSLLHRLQHHQHRATGYHGCQTPSHPGPAVAGHQGMDLGVYVCGWAESVHEMCFG